MVPIIGWAQIPVVPVLNKLFPDLDKALVMQRSDLRLRVISVQSKSVILR
jgi:hypothetical protein